jgi:hypothetical protein
MSYGISIALFPTKWELGHRRIRQKNVVAFGPLRFCLHRVKGSLKEYY